MMKIAVITYNVPHLKTQDLIFRLIEKNYKIKIITTRFKKFKKRNILHNHRPFQFIGPDPYELAKKLKLDIYKIEQIKLLKNIDFFLIGGCGLLKKEHIIKNKIINCHPGLIPQTRGLDSLKWALLKKQLIGNSLHFVDDTVDNGKLISHKLTPIFKSDKFDDLSLRHYKMEIDMLSDFEKHLKKPKKNKFVVNRPNKRMGTRDEKEMMKIFNKLKD
jgi:methionyl-tRNA formyltransferase